MTSYTHTASRRIRVACTNVFQAPFFLFKVHCTTCSSIPLGQLRRGSSLRRGCTASLDRIGQWRNEELRDRKNVRKVLKKLMSSVKCVRGRERKGHHARLCASRSFFSFCRLSSGERVVVSFISNLESRLSSLVQQNVANIFSLDLVNESESRRCTVIGVSNLYYDKL